MELEHSLKEKIIAFNKMISDTGSKVFLSSSKEPMEKANCLGRQFEVLQDLLATPQRNHAQTMKNYVTDGFSFALAKLKASDPSINLQDLEADFDYSEEEAAKIFEGVVPFGNKVTEEMKVKYPSHCNQSGGPEERMDVI